MAEASAVTNRERIDAMAARTLRLSARSAAARLGLRGVLARLRLWGALAAERRALSMLDDRLLRDIGLDRTDAAAEAARPFWDDAGVLPHRRG